MRPTVRQLRETKRHGRSNREIGSFDMWVWRCISRVALNGLMLGEEFDIEIGYVYLALSCFFKVHLCRAYFERQTI